MRRHRAITPLLLLLALLTAACDIDGEQDYGMPDPDPPSAPPPPNTAPSAERIQAACAQYAAAFCTRVDQCDGTGDTIEACTARQTRECVDDFADKSATCQNAYASALEDTCTRGVSTETCSTLCSTGQSGSVYCSDICFYFC